MRPNAKCFGNFSQQNEGYSLSQIIAKRGQRFIMGSLDKKLKFRNCLKSLAIGVWKDTLRIGGGRIYPFTRSVVSIR